MIGVKREEIAERMEMVMKLGGVPYFDSWLNHLNTQPPSAQRGLLSSRSFYTSHSG